MSDVEEYTAAWEGVDFSPLIFRSIYQQIVPDKNAKSNEISDGFENNKPGEDSKREWQLLISTPVSQETPDPKPNQLDWFKKKFMLDDEFGSKITRYQGFNIGLRYVTPETDIDAKWACTAGASIFDLPPISTEQTEEQK
jgi:hypothetical protein